MLILPSAQQDSNIQVSNIFSIALDGLSVGGGTILSERQKQ